MSKATMRVGSIVSYYGYLLLSRHADADGVVGWHWGLESYMGVGKWQPIPDYLSDALLRFREECPPPKDARFDEQ